MVRAEDRKCRSPSCLIKSSIYIEPGRLPIIITNMLSTKSENLSGKLKNPFAPSSSLYAGLSNPFAQYACTTNNNLALLRRRFPLEDAAKIRDLLDELDNNLEMVAEILQEGQEKHGMVSEKPAPKKMDLLDENKMLKSAITRLYKKLLAQEKELEAVKVTNEKAKKQNEDLRLQNCLLLQGEFSQNNFENARDVY